MPTTPVKALPYPLESAIADVPADMQALALAVDGLAIPPTTVVNGQWVKGVGGVAIWAGITPADIAGYPADATKYLRGDGTWAATGSAKITSQDISSGPPASPATGDIWNATNVDGAGVVWQFRYNAGSSSAYKWEFLGGAPMYSYYNAAPITSANGYTAIPPQLTMVRAGDYDFAYGCPKIQFQSGGSDVTYLTFGLGAPTSYGPSDNDAVSQFINNNNSTPGSVAMARRRYLGVGAGTVYTTYLRTWQGLYSFAWYYPYVAITPVRII